MKFEFLREDSPLSTARTLELGAFVVASLIFFVGSILDIILNKAANITNIGIACSTFAGVFVAGKTIQKFGEK